MPSPFPGMDPYIERPAIWPDFHDRLITCLQAALQPLLRPRFLAVVLNRRFVKETESQVHPDVTAGSDPFVELGVDVPAIFEFCREDVRQPLIHIIQPTANDRVVTAIEVLSQDNKQPGPGRASYVQTRKELWDNGANLVEIDLFREERTGAVNNVIKIPDEHLDTLRPFEYLVAVRRCWPSQHEVDAIPLRRRLPRIAIPLLPEDRDVVIDLQTEFTRCWDEGPYPELLCYQDSPPGPLLGEAIAWCEKVLRDAGYRKEKHP